MTRTLKLVDPPVTIEDVLRAAFPALEEAERESRRLREIIAEEGRALAKQRGVTFIRFEGLKREFGKP